MDPRSLGIIGFAAATFAWLLLAALLYARGAPGRNGRLLLAATLAQVAWAATMTLALVPLDAAIAATGTLEALRDLAWIIVLLQLIPASARRTGNNERLEGNRLAAMIAVVVLAIASIAADFLAAGANLVFATRTLLAVVGLVSLEQVYRNTPTTRRWALKFLTIALAAMFGFDLLMYSDAMLYARINGAWWITRGFANALLVPLMAVTAARNPQWKLDISVSRRVVFHSAALFGAGAYLVLVAAGGYYIRYFGGQWGEVAQALVAFGAIVGLLVILSSGSIRARLRVFLSKHFFSYRFDYRDEWLRLTRTLAERDYTEGTAQDLPVRVVRALLSPVESPGGGLWLRDGDDYRFAAGIPQRGPHPVIAADAPLLNFLRERDWVIEIDEWRAHPERYDGMALPDWLSAQAEAWLIVPLLLEQELLGFMLLSRPLAPLAVDWEVRDLLKTAARQAASYVGVQRAVEELVQARQFESFNRMSAFVVHDLKNLVAQLGLMTKNAHRHRDNPEFQADMLVTVENVMERMQGLLLQLRAGARPVEPPWPVLLGEALTQAVAARRGLRPEPSIEIDDAVAQYTVLAHRDRLERVIGHLVQNAAEATGPSGMIQVRARREGTEALIEVEDDGKGMSEDFVRGRLFRPFVSSKTHGMGIGTFESREYVRELGGSLDVESSEGVGTVFRIRLPLSGGPLAAATGA